MKTWLSVLVSGWVLWMNTGFADEFPVEKDQWKIHEAYESRSECHSERARLIELALKMANDKVTVKVSKSNPFYVIITGSEGRPQFTYYHCLPPEVDPRPRS